MVKKKPVKSAKKPAKNIIKQEIQIQPKKVEQDKFYNLKHASSELFGETADRLMPDMTQLQKALHTSGTKILFRTYLSMMVFLSTLFFILAGILTFIIGLLLGVGFIHLITWIIILSTMTAFTTFVIIYSYPFIRAGRRKTNIEANLPFALLHMAAVAGSGAPPKTMFKVLAKFKEYGDIADEAAKVVRNIDFFGLDEITAIRDVMNKTPSHQFKDILTGVLTTIQTGGDLKSYMQGEADRAMFDYRLNRERYSQTLATYADIYTAILIAAPLLFVVVLSILSIMGGQLFGMPIDMLMNIGIFGIIPLLNILFLIFIHSTQPKM